MEGWRENAWSWWKKKISSHHEVPYCSSKLWTFITGPVIVLVLGIVLMVALLGSKGSHWDFASYNYGRRHDPAWPAAASAGTAFSAAKQHHATASSSAALATSNVNVEDPVMSLSVSSPEHGGAAAAVLTRASTNTDDPRAPAPNSVGSGEVEAASLLLSHNVTFNHSIPVPPPPPPLGIEVGETSNLQAAEIQKERIFDIMANNSTTVSSSNHEAAHLARLHRKHSKLGMVESRMRQALVEIRSGSTKLYDPYYVPQGPMYWNAHSFHRSYLEMEKQFKVYVYEEGEPPIFHNGPCKSIYAMEGNFIHQMEVTKFRTRDPNQAHVYFLPISVTTIVHFIYDKTLSDHWKPMKQTIKDYVNLVSAMYPYWNRSLGADHFMLACHDWGPELSSSVTELYKNSIRALCNANTSEGFDPQKDVSFPEIHLPRGTIEGLIGGPSPSQRPVLVFFSGGLHGPIRPVLFENWENKDENVQVHKYLPKGVSYYGMMKKSKFCICPSGYEVASPRLVEALYTGCVPVLIKDHYVLPFSDVLNWKTFSVEIPVEEIPNLKKILTSISSRQYIRMQRRGKQIRRHFEVNFPPKRYDVFHMILHSVWLRRLNVQLDGTKDF